jgi:chromosome segregation ATPase
LFIDTVLFSKRHLIAGENIMQKKLRTLLILSFLALFGCKSALLELQKDNEIRADRIKTKEVVRDNLEDQNQQLLNEKNKLLSELDQKNITLNELNARLAKLKAANLQIRAVTDEERKRQAALSGKLDNYTREINTLKKDKHMGLEEKKKEIEELKQNIKAKVLEDTEFFQN